MDTLDEAILVTELDEKAYSIYKEIDEKTDLEMLGALLTQRDPLSFYFSSNQFL